MVQLLTVKRVASQLGPAEVRRGGVQQAQTALCARLSEPGAVRESTRSAPCQEWPNPVHPQGRTPKRLSRGCARLNSGCDDAQIVLKVRTKALGRVTLGILPSRA